MTDTLYSTNRQMRDSRIPVQKIDVCPNGCMLFLKDAENLSRCSICGAHRYKVNIGGKKHVAHKVLHYFLITPRLQRLYAIKSIADAMSWHASNYKFENMMLHPSDSEAWNHLDREFP